MRTAVVYVHGLWMTGIEGVFLRARLAKALNAATPFFSYPSARRGVVENTRLLDEKLRSLDVDTLHLVGHSLGGVLICNLFDRGLGVELPPGRVVLLGSPLTGSVVARNLASWPLGRIVLGKSVIGELLQPRARCWCNIRELGVIAGTRKVGLGRIAGVDSRASDGTVLVEETHIDGAKERLLLPVSHTGMQFSSEVAARTAAFLRNGSFGVSMR
jgi:pimeloyl-ACP methyl ester carboxylesterase